VKYLLLFLLLAFVVGVRSVHRPSTRAWPFVILAFALGAGFLSLAVI